MSFWEDFKIGQKEFGEDIAAIINTVLLTFVYLVGIGLTSIVAKIVGKKFLDLYPEKEKDSYWEELNLSRNPVETYYRQF